MPSWCCGVRIERNEGTIIFGNIKQYSPVSNTVAGPIEEKKAAREEQLAESQGCRRFKRKKRRRIKKGTRGNGQRVKSLYFKKGGRVLLYAPFIKT
ncbi:hypothetical protein ACFQZE_13180 [Paenibacillus sp. GCM10027627]|uniref:hypothetical protein n=1 Tax=unclassified Paenibacillus TaxID=185978 RepID=UPI00363D5B52